VSVSVFEFVSVSVFTFKFVSAVCLWQVCIKRKIYDFVKI